MNVDDLLQVGLKPVLAGCAVMIVSAIAGWGIAADRSLPPVRAVGFWLRRVLMRWLTSASWAVRSLAILVNNASICALLILAGGLPGGAWVGITLVGLSMGIALRLLGDQSAMRSVDDGGENALADNELGPMPDRTSAVAMAVNLIEVPAIAIVLGLAMGQLAAPNDMNVAQIWSVYLYWVLPLLIVAAGAESLWIGRLQPFATH